eukprot:s123_g5.t2
MVSTGTAATLILPSLGFVLDDGGRIAEVACTCNGVVAPGGGPPSFSARGSVPTKQSSSKGKSNSKSRAGAGEIQHLGVPHSARLHPVTGVNEEDQISTCLKVAAEDPSETYRKSEFLLFGKSRAECSRVKMAFQHMCPYFAALKPGSLVLEVGSRSGDVTVMFAERFPEHRERKELYIQPTEGTGDTSPGLFMLLQERLTMVRKDLQPRKKTKRRAVASENVPRSRVLPPKFLDGGKKGWRTKLGQEIHCIFCVNVLHYVSPLGLENFLQGCSDHLPVGGMLLVSGPFFNNGEAAETLLVYDAALRAFADGPERQSASPLWQEAEVGSARHRLEGLSGRDFQCCCHDVVRLKAMGAQVGLSFVAQSETDGVGGHSWILLAFCKERRLLPETLRRRSSTVQSGLFNTG